LTEHTTLGTAVFTFIGRPLFVRDEVRAAARMAFESKGEMGIVLEQGMAFARRVKNGGPHNRHGVYMEKMEMADCDM
jgi:hypothetical protein